MELSKYCINETETIIAATSAIEENKERSIFIVNENKKLIGVLSQGDILKALLEGINVYTQVNQIYNRSFIYLNSIDMDKAKKIIQSKNISLIPVINKDFNLTNIITIKQVISYLDR